MTISKSKFVAGVQYLKRPYLLAHEPAMSAQANEAGETIIPKGQCASGCLRVNRSPAG
jgi:hypothetical protein